MWLVGLALTGCVGLPEVAPEALDRLEGLTLAARGAPPTDPTNVHADDPAAAHLGQWLFFDRGLSIDGQVACATCHDPARAFSDASPISDTLGPTDRHTPSLFNLAWSRWFNWDGRCDTLWCQATGPIEADHEMGFDRAALAHRIAADPALHAAFVEVFGPLPALDDVPPHALPGGPDDPRTAAWDALDSATQEGLTQVLVHVAKAIAAYQRRLVTSETPFDAFVAAMRARDAQGAAVLSEEAVAGAVLFVGEADCVACHFGPLLTNGEFHNVGLGTRPWLPAQDLGRHAGIDALRAHPFSGAGVWSDDPTASAERIARLVQGDEQVGQFKTPSLREVARSGPYAHGGHFDTLADVVAHYDRPFDEAFQAGTLDGAVEPLFLFPEDRAAIVAFLESLSADPGIDPALRRPPEGPIAPR